MGSFELPERSRRLLATLVREYIDSGEPVSSQIIAHRSGLGLSSATVRNVLAQLEEHGYVHQPHTSAGRVPTDLGYRVFVDMLLESRTPAVSHVDVEQQLRRQQVQTPLMAWLNAGGHLIVGIEQMNDITASAWLKNLMPCEIKEIRHVQRHRGKRSASAGRGARPDAQWSLQRPAECRVAGEQHHEAVGRRRR